MGTADQGERGGDADANTLSAYAEKPEFIVETQGHVRVLTINRPHRRNALTPAVQTAMSEAFIEADEDPNIRAVVLTGVGDAAFCAGSDLKERKKGLDEGKSLGYRMRTLQRFGLEIMWETYKPTIAALNGATIGGGFERALACDMRIAAEHIVMGLPEAKRGAGAHFSSIVLPRVIPRAIALEMLFSGEYITAQQALQYGLVNRVVAKGKALESALALATAIAKNAPITVRRMKETASKSSGLTVAAALRLNEGLNPYLAEDRKEGTRAFVEKRAPQWKGR